MSIKRNKPPVVTDGRLISFVSLFHVPGFLKNRSRDFEGWDNSHLVVHDQNMKNTLEEFFEILIDHFTGDLLVVDLVIA